MVKNTTNKKEASRWFSPKTLFLVGVFFVLGTMLLVSMLGGQFGFLQRLTLDGVGPLQHLVSVTLQGAENLKDDYIALWKVRAENKRLHAVNQKYLQELGVYREGYRKYLHYEKLLDFKEKRGFGLLTCRVVGHDPGAWYQTIVIDRGKDDDIVVGMVVVSPQGVVGQVIHVADHYSKVLLANAPSSAIDAIVQKNRVRGILKGAGKNGYTLEYVLKNVDVSEGDDIVTAGIGGVFGSGIPLGTVSEVVSQQRGMFFEIKVQPSVDFETLEEVFVDLNNSHELIRDMVLENLR